MNRTYFLSKNDIIAIGKAYKDLNSVLIEQTTIFGKIKKFKVKKFGLRLKKATGKESKKIIFDGNKKPSGVNEFYIDIGDKNLEKTIRKTLIKIILSKNNISFAFNNFDSYKVKNLFLLEKYINQIHPEALILAPICIGEGIDVGCGFRKTHPDSMGIDLIEKGKKGLVGNVKGKISEADVVTEGDNLKMFKNNSLDYVVSRHNLEHYRNPQKTLREWIRVLKRGGILGIVVPNGENPETNEETHYSYFNLKTFRDIIIETNSLKIIRIDECIPNWSFYCIAKKIN